MKRIITPFSLLMAVCLLFSTQVMPQIHQYIPRIDPKIYRIGPNRIGPDYPCGKEVAQTNIGHGFSENKSAPVDSVTMMSYFDMQAFYSLGDERLYYWPSDNTMAACAHWSMDTQGRFLDMGIGYNFFNGTQWGSQPDGTIDLLATCDPSLQPLGTNGECLVSGNNSYFNYYSYGPIYFLKRNPKGSGSWLQYLVPDQTGLSGMAYPRMVTSGSDGMTVNILALTVGSYNDMYNALLYIRSADGGETWGNWQQLPGMDTSNYATYGFGTETYAWAHPHGDTLCFVVSSPVMDAFIMKSTDNGNSWTKTIIYNSPYDWGLYNSTGWFWCPDGSCDVALDKSGMAHVTFALEDDKISDGEILHQSMANGIAYWNESMPPLGQVLNYDTLLAHHQLIGWITDTMVFHNGETPGGYFGAIATNPSMAIDNDNNMFIVWMNPTSVGDGYGYDLTHIYERTAIITSGSDIWWNDSIIDLTSNPYYHYKECVYPSLSPTTSDDKFFMLFQWDDRAGAFAVNVINGAYCYNGQEGETTNCTTVMSVMKNQVGVGIKENKLNNPGFTVSDNFPNPFRESTTYIVKTGIAGDICLEIDDLYGQQISVVDKGHYSSGTYNFTVDATNYTPGIYFFTVKLNNVPVTKKMIVD
jgi:hypothetical protein